MKNLGGTSFAFDLLSAFEKAMTKKGMQKCTLWVSDLNLRAINFYKKVGWQPFEQREGDILFIKNI